MTKLGSTCIVILILAAAACYHESRSQSLSSGSLALITGANSHYQVIDLGTLPGDNWTETNGINDKGQVLCTAGIRKDYDPHIKGTRAFLWENGHRRNLGILPLYPMSQGIAINNSGQVIGTISSSDTMNSDTRVFLWQNGKMRKLQMLSLPGSTPYALSDQADIVGAALPPKMTEAKNASAFLWEAGKSRYLSLPFPSTATAIVHRRATDPLIIVGDIQGNGFLWRNGKFLKLHTEGVWGTQLRAVNASGQSVGCVSLTTGHSHALLWQNGRLTDLGTLAPKHDSIATAINDKGMIVGWATKTPDDAMHAVLWNGNSIKDLNDEISTNPNIILSNAKGINHHNQIVCDGIPADESPTEQQQQHTYLLTPR